MYVMEISIPFMESPIIHVLGAEILPGRAKIFDKPGNHAAKKFQPPLQRV